MTPLTPKESLTIKTRVLGIEAMLAGLEPQIVGAILADITATWLAGFQGQGAAEMREGLLQMHINYVRELIPVNEQIAAERQMKEQDGKLQ
jgi:hypothetical protein